MCIGINARCVLSSSIVFKFVRLRRARMPRCMCISVCAGVHAFGTLAGAPASPAAARPGRDERARLRHSAAHLPRDAHAPGSMSAHCIHTYTHRSDSYASCGLILSTPHVPPPCVTGSPRLSPCQVISQDQQCTHTSERQESFFMLSVAVKNKPTLVRAALVLARASTPTMRVPCQP